MKRPAKFIALTFLATTLALPAFAGGVAMDNSKSVPMMSQPEPEARWYISAGGGAAFDVSGTLNDSFRGTFPLILIGSTTLKIRETDYSDVYNASSRIRAEVGYALTSRLDVFGKFEYENAQGGTDSNSRIIFQGGTGALANFIPGGAVGGVSNSSASFAIDRHFNDYQRYGGELGLRYSFLPKTGHWQVFAAISGGASTVSAINNRSDINFGNGFVFQVYDGPLYNDSIVGTGSGVLGVEYAFTKNALIGVDAGLNYHSSLDGDDSGFNRSPGGLPAIFGFNNYSFLNGINDTGERWSVPVTGYVKIRF